MQLQDALDRFLVQLNADGRSLHTRRQYQRHVRLFARWLADEGRAPTIGDVDHETIAAFLTSPAARCRPDGSVKKATSTNALRSSLRMFFGYTHAAGWTTANPARLVRRARCTTPPPRPLSDHEVDQMLAALDEADGFAGHRDRVLIQTLLATGIRIGSAIALDIEDLDLDAGEMLLRSTKGDRPTRVLVNAQTCDLLRGWLGDRVTGPVFTTEAGARLSVRQAQRRFVDWAAAAGITRKVSVHMVRHTFGTRIYRRTGDLLLTRDAMRHASVASTMAYASGSDARLRTALA